MHHNADVNNSEQILKNAKKKKVLSFFVNNVEKYKRQNSEEPGYKLHTRQD